MYTVHHDHEGWHVVLNGRRVFPPFSEQQVAEDVARALNQSKSRDE